MECQKFRLKKMDSERLLRLGLATVQDDSAARDQPFGHLSLCFFLAQRHKMSPTSCNLFTKNTGEKTQTYKEAGRIMPHGQNGEMLNLQFSV